MQVARGSGVRAEEGQGLEGPADRVLDGLVVVGQRGQVDGLPWITTMEVRSGSGSCVVLVLGANGGVLVTV